MPTRQGSRAQSAPAKDTEEKKPAQAGKTTKKLLLTDKVQTFLKGVPTIPAENIHEILEQVVTDENGKNNVCFIVFSDGQKDKPVDEETNIAMIKEALFAYHIAKDEKIKGKQLMFNVLPPDTDEATHVLYAQEV